jgi:hypothetical protein
MKRESCGYYFIESSLLPTVERQNLVARVGPTWMQDMSLVVYQFLVDFAVLCVYRRKGEDLWRTLSVSLSLPTARSSRSRGIQGARRASNDGDAENATASGESRQAWPKVDALLAEIGKQPRRRRRESKYDAQRAAYKMQVQQIRDILQVPSKDADARSPAHSRPASSHPL